MSNAKTMTAPINHVERAEARLAAAWDVRHNPELSARYTAMAQAHATLALTQQQQTANDLQAEILKLNTDRHAASDAYPKRISKIDK